MTTEIKHVKAPAKSYSSMEDWGWLDLGEIVYNFLVKVGRGIAKIVIILCNMYPLLVLLAFIYATYRYIQFFLS